MTTRITPMLWFDNQAEEAANFYVSIFKNSRITNTARYGENMPGPAGSVMVVAFELDGQPFTALNGGPQFKFSEAISFVVDCNGQQELDYYWDKLIAGGGAPQQCGWLKDKYGLSWQVVPDGGNRDDVGSRSREIAARDERRDEDDQARSGAAAPGLENR